MRACVTLIWAGGIVPPVLYVRMPAFSESWHMANARLSELVQAGERQCAVAVWQLKHGRSTLRQLFDTCPQHRETGLHSTP